MEYCIRWLLAFILHAVCRQVTEAHAQQADASAALDSAQAEVAQLKLLAAERQKRFVMLNGTFKRKEDELKERADAAERQTAEAQREAEAAKAQAVDAVKVRQGLHRLAAACLLLPVLPCILVDLQDRQHP